MPDALAAESLPHSIIAAVRWYLVLTLVGAGALLPSTLLFGRLRSAGVLFARPIGLLVISYLVWVGAAIGPVGYGTALVVAALGALWGWTGWLAWRRPGSWRLVREHRGLIVAGEALFVVLFAAILWVRFQAPAATFTEKPMDLMLLNAVHRAEHFPPPDAWYGGRPVSYYHLGHVSVDVLSRLAGVRSGLAFNFGVASAGALAGAAMFGLAGDVAALGSPRRRATLWVAGAMAVLALLAVSTLEGGLEMVAANGLGGAGFWGKLDVDGFPAAEGALNGVPADFWWWWRATRILPNTIVEFPAFSLILGDLHAHLMALPLAVTALGVAATAFEGSTALTWRSWLQRPGALVLASLLFAGLVMTNSWDALFYGVVWGAAGVAAYLGVGWGLGGALFGTARHLALPAALAALLSWPFLGTLEHVPVGVSAVTGEASYALGFTLIWLAPLAPALAAFALLRPRVSKRAFVLASGLGALAVLTWVIVVTAGEHGDALGIRGWGWLTLAVLVPGIGACAGASAAAHADLRRSRAAWTGLLALGGAIVLASELVFLSDAMPGRTNTVFKFWYGVWVLVALAGSVAAADMIEGGRGAAQGSVVRAASRAAGARRATGRAALTLLLACLAMLFGLSLLYAPAAAVARGREELWPKGLDAVAYLANEDPGLARAREWVRANLEGDAVLLEAAGPSYQTGNRLSASTGVPTVLGWPGHERQWRASSEAVSARQRDVDAFFRAGAGAEALAIARRYGVTHVYLGSEERAQYGADVAARFAGWPQVFDAAGARILEVPGATSEAPG